MEGPEFWCCTLDDRYMQEIMVYTQSHAANVQMLYNRFQRPWHKADRRCAE